MRSIRIRECLSDNFGIYFVNFITRSQFIDGLTIEGFTGNCIFMCFKKIGNLLFTFIELLPHSGWSLLCLFVQFEKLSRNCELANYEDFFQFIRKEFSI